MTDLTSRVSRRTRGSYAVLFRQPRRIVVTLAPGDLIEFREHGRRQAWALPVDVAFRSAVRLKAMADKAEKKRRTP